MSGNGPRKEITRMAIAPFGALLTDLYQINMLQAYFDAGMAETAVFELFVRRLPSRRNFLMAAGLAQAVEHLASMRFSVDDIAWLNSSGRFTRPFLAWLADLRFTGDVDAMAEGTVFFADEPILRVTAPLPQAQLVESRLINLIHFQTVVASKAARMVLAAPGRRLIDFGLRRAHGAEAGLYAARASYLAGFAGTATVVAEPLLGIPAFGTMAHSFILAHDSETEAFLQFARARPRNLVLLLDTYDTEAAAQKVVGLAPILRQEGIAIIGVRLDSGNLGAHAHHVRAILDAGGLAQVQILASGGLDEDALADLATAPIDAYGVGTALATSSDAPVLDCAYKLQSYAGRPKRKLSEGKANWPGAKQVFRRADDTGQMVEDQLVLAEEQPTGTPLLGPVMRRGEPLPQPTLMDSRAHAAAQLLALPPALRRLDTAPAYPVAVSGAVRDLASQTDAAVVRG